MSSFGIENISRLILGTVQFGLNYGISNKQGQITQQEVNSILTKASEAGIQTLDTAVAYGKSEESIGSYFRKTNSSFYIISKFPPNKPELTVAEAFQNSLDNLGVLHLHAYLLHSYTSYRSKPAILNELQELKENGKVNKIGFSLYHPIEAVEVLEKDLRIDLVQIPYNVFDRRFEEVMPLLREKGIQTHVRSVYLQGLYFVSPDALPAHFSSVAGKLQDLQQLAKDNQVPVGAMLLGFVLANKSVSNVVIGVESLTTLNENIDYCYTKVPKQLLEELKSFQEDNEDIILPYNWTNI